MSVPHEPGKHAGDGSEKGATRPTPAQRLARTAAMTRSMLSRYPKQIMSALTDAAALDIGPPGPGAGSVIREHAGGTEPVGELPPVDLSHAHLAATWLGHATVLMHIAGLHVLTDPVFSDRIGVSVGPITIGPQRLAAPAIEPQRLPPIDLILLSHAHFDHLDKPSLRTLASPRTIVVTARNTGKLVPPGFADVIELDWFKSLDLPLRAGGSQGLRLTALKPAHWGARTALDRHRKFNSYLIEHVGHAPRGVLYAGDTAYTAAFDDLARRAGTRLDLAIMGIGAYDPWIHHHASPEEVWRMFTASGASHLLPIHHSTFRLSDEPDDEPLRRLLAAAREHLHRLAATTPGQVWTAAH